MMKNDLSDQAARAVPAVLGAASSEAARAHNYFTVSEIVAILTGVYIAVQLAYLIRKWWIKERRDWADDEE